MSVFNLLVHHDMPFIYLLYIFCHVLHFSLVLETWMFFLNSREPDTWFYNGILPQGFFVLLFSSHHPQ